MLMRLRFVVSALFLSTSIAVQSLGQENPLRGQETQGGTAAPDQPVLPQTPTLIQRPAQSSADQTPKPPFTLTAQEEAQVDSVLNRWEEHNRSIKTFDCQFTRWIYDMIFGPANRPKFIDSGIIKYAAPDRGMFRVETTERDGKNVPVENARAEHWISDGKSIFEFNPGKKQLTEHKLPPELQGKAIADSPLPFFFGAEAKKLKQRYFIRLLPPPNGGQDQIWLEAYPRFQQDAANWRRATFIISAHDMAPFGLEILQPNGKDYTRYRFSDIVVNDPLRLFKGDPFRAFTPLGWRKIVEEPPAAQARRPPDEQR
jgi:TIGR03009 family protein